MLEGEEVEADAMKSLELGAFLSVLGSAQFLSYLILLPCCPVQHPPDFSLELRCAGHYCLYQRSLPNFSLET